MLRCLLVVALIGIAIAIPRKDADSAPCACNTRANQGYAGATCKCEETSVFSMAGINSLVGLEASLTGPPSNQTCECEVKKVPGYSDGGAGCTCAANYIPCPPHSSGHPVCIVDPGYLGTVTWDDTKEDYVIRNPTTQMPLDAVEPTPGECGEMGADWPNCRCIDGYDGEFMWNEGSMTWSNNCSAVACPQNSENEPNCVCKEGYRAAIAITFDRQSSPRKWNGQCTKVNCPTNSNSLVHPTCPCSRGYTGATTFSFSDETYSSECKLAICPAHGKHSVTDGETCECEKGYLEADDLPLDFDFDSQAWTGRCDAVTCPDHAEGHPHCYCKIGYIGNLTWSGETYDGTCEAVPCPAGAEGPGCPCLGGYIYSHSTPQWDDTSKSWTHTCSAISACPIGCSSADVSTCRCDMVGFVGNPPLSWTGTTYGTCKVVHCPPHTISMATAGGNDPACGCDVGYNGSVSWHNDLSTWISTCEVTPCPGHSECSTIAKRAYCSNGYSGAVVWNPTILRWESTCAKVDCPLGSINHPACQCGRGWSGGDATGLLVWSRNDTNGDESKYQGVCTGEETVEQYSEFVCSGSDHSLTCSKGMSIHVTRAHWGRSRADVCQTGNYQLTGGESGCTSDNALTALQTQCEGQQSCVASASIASFGDPCSGSHSLYLDLAYECRGAPQTPCDSLCEQVECPANSNKNSDGSCTCHFGYTGTISWERPVYTGVCVEAACPANSTVASGPDCACKKGFLPSTTFGFSNGKWHGMCNYQSCGEHGINHPDCECASGAWYRNNIPIKWNEGTGYSGACLAWPCPSNAEVDGVCNCKTGYKTTSALEGGTLSGPFWMGGAWFHACERVDCPAGSGTSVHPNCACDKGYSGYPSWDRESLTWSGCVEVPCEADRNMVKLATTGHACGCAEGHLGSTGWDSVHQRWNSGCNPAPCPGQADCSGDSAACGKGYTGTVVWNSISTTYGEWNATCTEVACPSNSGSHPDCTCKTGFAGGVLSFVDGAYGACTEISCPANSDRLSNGNCRCKTGFAGTIGWNASAGIYEGGCTLVTDCVENAIGAPECHCERGYRRSVDFGFSYNSETWVGRCSAQECPLHSEKTHTNCTCSTGYFGTISWDSSNEEYIGECTKGACPPHSAGDHCTCNSGYSGIALWDGQQWGHTCHEIACPAGTTRTDLATGGFTCLCPIPTSGVPVWTGTEWDIECSDVACPMNSLVNAANISECDCSEGFKGSPKWNTRLMQYDGTCDLITCPEPAIGEGGTTGCMCPVGMSGDCVYDATELEYVCTCASIGCPANAVADTEGVCACARGYAGHILWQTDQTWTGTCERVDCPSGVLGWPNCACAHGWASTVAWDDDNDSWTGGCIEVQCPINSEGHPHCVPQLGYRLVDDITIQWNSTSNGFDGAVEVIECVANAENTPCTCKKGYANDNMQLVGTTYSGSCNMIPCTDGHGGFPDCACDAGYFGAMEWKAEEGRWESTCQVRACPEHASGPLVCGCNEGYTGDAQWNSTTQVWDHECHKVLCPTHASSHPNCECSSGYAGDISWDPSSRAYVGTCALSTCPEGSVRRFSLPAGHDASGHLKTSTLTESGVYRIKSILGDFSAYLEVENGEVWAKVNQWGTVYTPTSQAAGSIASTASHDGKLSDIQINFLANPTTSQRMYRIDWDGTQKPAGDTRKLYVHSNKVYADGSASFGLKGADTKTRMSDTTPSADHDWSSDQSYTGDAMTGSECEAVFMGVGEFDCPGNPGKRCLNGGNQCEGSQTSYPMLNHVSIYVKLEREVEMHPTFDASHLTAVTESDGTVYTPPIPGCDCLVGCAGSWEWIRTSYSGECLCADCPPNGDCTTLAANPLLADTVYPCKKGYSGHVMWDGTNWIDNCVRVDCPGDSVNFPDCHCPSGFTGDVTYAYSWNADAGEGTASYTGGICTQVECPSAMIRGETDGVVDCSCASGFSGYAAWNLTTKAFEGQAACAYIPCPLGMSKNTDGTVCTCPVSKTGRAIWNTQAGIYVGDSSCVTAVCPAGATCDTMATSRKCARYYSGRYEWNSESQVWNSTCLLAPCSNGQLKTTAAGAPDGCECFRGFGPSSSWSTTTQSYSGCSVDATCPTNADDTERDTATNGRLCRCKPGFYGYADWNSGTATYAHTCSMVSCTEVPGSYRDSSMACDCDVGYVGGHPLDWSYTDMMYTSSCTLASCPEQADCTTIADPSARTIKTILPCKEGYYGSAVWNAGTQQWDNNCLERTCPSGSTRTVFPACDCRWGFTGSIAWNTGSQNYDNLCVPVDCPAPSLGNGDGHCRCPRGTEVGTLKFTNTDEWEISCSANRACPDFATANAGDCSCDKGYAGTIDTLVTYNVQDSAQVSVAEYSTEYSGACTRLNCPENTLSGSFPDCSCASGFKGVVEWKDQTWESTCQHATCPENASGAPTCQCKKGYLPNPITGLTFNMTSQAWEGGCVLAACPADATSASKNGVRSCRCNNGFSGTQSWVQNTGWTHTCTEASCPSLSTKVAVSSGVEYQAYNGFMGCQHEGQQLGLISMDQLDPAPAMPCASLDVCLTEAKAACQQIISAGGACWGFAISRSLQMKLYSPHASDYSSCNSDNGLHANADWTSYRRRSAMGDCRCVAGYGGGFIWNGMSYDGGCSKDQCPEHSTCGETVQCIQGYTGASTFNWNFDNEKWEGTCSPLSCGPSDVATSFPNCECSKGFSGGLHGWDFSTEAWTGACTKVACPTNSDQEFPNCRCSSGFVRSDGVVNSMVTWNGNTWDQTCAAVDCPTGSSRKSNSACQCDTGYKGLVTFKMDQGKYSVSQGSTDMLSCNRIACPAHSKETIVTTADGSTAPVCHCENGYAGNLEWDHNSFSWGTCAQMACPENSENHPNCVCKAGFTGEIEWTGQAYSGSCTAMDTAPAWISLSTVDHTISCHRVRGPTATSAVKLAGDTMEFDFHGSTDTINILQCDVRLKSQFTKVRGSYTVTPQLGGVANTFQTVGWNSSEVTAATHYVAMGTVFTVVDPGMEGGTGEKTYLAGQGAVGINVPETAVTETDTIRFEVSQAAGVSLQVSNLTFEVYVTPDGVVSCTKTAAQ